MNTVHRPGRVQTASGVSSGATRLRRAGLAVALGLGVLGAPALSGGPAAAQMMLYENRLPDGFAYVRFANTLTEELAVKPAGFADPVTLGATGAARISAYFVVENVAGRTLHADFGAGGAEHADFELKPGLFHTLLIARDGGQLVTKVVTDQAEMSQTKARLAFYNAVPDCPAAGLQLEAGGQAVFSGVGPNLMRGRSVNPAANPRVRASCGGARVVPFELGQLDAGGQYSVWLMAPSGTPTAFLTKNAIAPFLR